MGRFGCLAAFLAGATILAAPARADEWKKTYTISGRADLRVTTDDGNVSVIASDQKQIDARVTTEGYRIESGGVRINENQTGDAVTLEVKLPHMDWHIFGGRHKSVNVELRVPRDLNLDVHTGDGNVTSTGVSGRIVVDTGDGNISANSVKGDIHLKTGDGHVEAYDLDGSLDVNTGDGHVSVRGRFDALTLHTGDGSIEARAMAGSKVAGTWKMHSGDGHINLWVPGDLNAEVDAHTGDGRITMDLPLMVSGSLNHSHVHGKLNGGGGMVSITTGDGSIHLQKM